MTTVLRRREGFGHRHAQRGDDVKMWEAGEKAKG